MSSTTLIRMRASLAPSPSAPQSMQTNAGPYFHYAGGRLRQFDLRQKCSPWAPVGGAVRRTQPAVGSDDVRVGTTAVVEPGEVGPLAPRQIGVLEPEAASPRATAPGSNICSSVCRIMTFSDWDQAFARVTPPGRTCEDP